jgi:quercetin dioxygenase-like cupin family protein
MKAASALVAFAFVAASAWAQQDPHKMTLPKDLKWEAVPSLPKGAQIAVIEGPMNQAAPFTVRLKFPANYRIPPHHHPAVERVTVLSGTFNMGIGEKFDQKSTHALPVGGTMIMQPKTPHFAWTKEEVVVQLHGTGPWGVTYVDPADDPRKQQ